MRGHFDVFVKEASSLRDEDFLLAAREGRLNELLDSLRTEQEAHSDNQIFHGFPIALFRIAFAHGLPNGAYCMDRATGIPFYNIIVLSTASEPSYLEWTAWYGNLHSQSGSVDTSNAGKRFVVHAMDTYVAVEPDGREGVFLRSRWLYVPSQIVSSEIRSIGAAWCEYVTDSNDERQSMARVRLKDAGGNPITLSKASNQALLVQYTATLVSL